MEKNVAETPFSVHTISFRCENDPRVAKKSSQASLSRRIYVPSDEVSLPFSRKRKVRDYVGGAGARRCIT